MTDATTEIRERQRIDELEALRKLVVVRGEAIDNLYLALMRAHDALLTINPYSTAMEIDRSLSAIRRQAKDSIEKHQSRKDESCGK